MKAVILAGGMGTRLSEETDRRPKPLIEIGGQPILWHIMKLYSHYDINEFIICLGYKGYLIKEFFANYFLHTSDVTLDLQTNRMQVHHQKAEPWTVTLIDTGLQTMTGGRLRRVRDYIGDKTFCFTYGDGVANVNIERLITHHYQHQCLATVTAVRAPGRFGSLSTGSGKVSIFYEKPIGDGLWINGGFFVLEPGVLDYIQDDATAWELDPMNRLAQDGQLHAFQHDGFWHAMDTIRDRQNLEERWTQNDAPWKIWK